MSVWFTYHGTNLLFYRKSNSSNFIWMHLTIIVCIQIMVWVHYCVLLRFLTSFGLIGPIRMLGKYIDTPIKISLWGYTQIESTDKLESKLVRVPATSSRIFLVSLFIHNSKEHFKTFKWDLWGKLCLFWLSYKNWPVPSESGLE